MLQGMKILSLCHYLQGPAAVQYLADMGADVIKIEPPGGAFERHWAGADTFVGGVSSLYLCANRNKRSLALDLKSGPGREIFLRLVETADVVVENFRPGVMDRLGLGHEQLKLRQPGLILASASGFGSTGPMAGKPGQDLLIQARTGLMGVTADPRRPVAAGCAVADQHGASLLAMGILGAYVKRLATGKGSRVEASLFNAGIDLQMESISNYLSGGYKRAQFARDGHLGSWFHQAPYGIYEAADGFVAISNVDAHALAEALDSDLLREMANIDRYKERDRYAQAVTMVVGMRTMEQISTAFDAAAIWYAPVRGYDDLPSDPQAIHNQVFSQVDVNGETATLVNHPLRYDGQVPALRHLALELGQHSREILAELGYTDEAIDAFIAEGIVNAMMEVQ